jgi:hypothetical protein
MEKKTVRLICQQKLKFYKLFYLFIKKQIKSASYMTAF